MFNVSFTRTRNDKFILHRPITVAGNRIRMMVIAVVIEVIIMTIFTTMIMIITMMIMILKTMMISILTKTVFHGPFSSSISAVRTITKTITSNEKTSRRPLTKDSGNIIVIRNVTGYLLLLSSVNIE